MTTASITIAAPYGAHRLLRRAVARGVAARRAVRADERWSRVGLPSAERVRVSVALAEHLAGLRESGEVRDSARLVFEHGLREMLAAYGWDKKWSKLPTEGRKPGRWWGSEDHGWAESIPIRIDAALAEQVRAACWHTSAEAIGELHRWRDRNPEETSDVKELNKYRALSALVTTPGDAWRDGLMRAVALPSRDEVLRLR